jgi:hypothetical protein
VADRSIPIRLKRRSPNEKVERFRDRTAPAAARPIRNRLVAWAGANMEALREVVPPVLPEVLSDRQQDGAEPLVTIADLIGGEWPFRARSCLVEVLHFDGASTESIGTRLLADIKTVFDSRASDRIFSKDLCQGLVEIETSPWAEWSHGKPLSLGKLARLLAPYGIVPGTVRIATATAKGYVRDDFADAWGRYLQKDPESPFTPHSDFQNVTTPQPAPDAASVHFQSGTQEDDVTDQNEPKPAPEGSCDVVTFSKQNMAAKLLIRGEI